MVRGSGGVGGPQETSISSVQGTTSDELKSISTNSKDVLPVAVSPLASSEATKLVGGGDRNLDALRLAAPESADPSQVRPNHFGVRKALETYTKPSSRELMTLLQNPPPELSKEQVGFLRASAAREEQMMRLLTDHQQNTLEIHHRLIGSQGG